MEAEEIEYKNNFLTNVIFRLDISSLIEIGEDFLVNFQKEIISVYPIFERVENKIANIMAMTDAEPKVSTMFIQHYIYWGKNKEYKLTISTQAFTVEVFKYGN